MVFRVVGGRVEASVDWQNSYRWQDGLRISGNSGMQPDERTAIQELCRNTFVKLCLRAPAPLVRILQKPFADSPNAELRIWKRVQELQQQQQPPPGPPGPPAAAVAAATPQQPPPGPPAAPAATPLPGPPPSRPPPHVTQQQQQPNAMAEHALQRLVWRANNLGVGLLEVTQQQQQPTAANSSSQQPQPTTAAANSNHNLAKAPRPVASQSECHQPRPMESAPSNHVASMSGAEQKTQPCSSHITQSQPLTTQSRPGTAEVREWVPPSVHQPPTQQGPQRQVEAVPNATESVQGVNEASGCKRSGSEKVDQNTSTTAKCINETDAASSTSESESGLFGFVKVPPDD